MQPIISSAEGHLVGRLNISTPGYESIELEVDVSPHATTLSNVVYLNVLRCPARTSSTGVPNVVTAARAFAYKEPALTGSTPGNPWAYVDIYVENVPSNSNYLNNITVGLDVEGYETWGSGQLQLYTPIELLSNTNMPSGTQLIGSGWVQTYRP